MKSCFVFLLVFFSSTAFCQFSFITHTYNVPGGAFVNHAAVGDFNGDGKPDVIVAGNYAGQSPSNNFFIFMSNAADSLDTAAVLVHYQHPDTINSGANAMAVADMNNDNLDDIVIATYDSVYVYYQQPNHTFKVSSSSRYGETMVEALRIADIDNDGHKDIVIGAFNNAITVLYGTAVTDNFVQVDYPAASIATTDLIVAKLGHDTALSIVSMPDFQSFNKITAVKINHNRQVNSINGLSISESTFPILQSLAVGDRYSSGNNELYVLEQADSMIQWSRADIDTVSDSLYGPQFNGNAQLVLVNDLNCDGKGEIILAGGQSLSVIDQASNETSFFVPVDNNLDYDDMMVANVIGDAKPDIIIANTYGGVIVLENTSLGTDSTITHTDTLTAHSNTVITSYNILVLADTFYRSNDTLVLQNDSVKIGYGYTDSILQIVHSGIGVTRCGGDTTPFNDTVNTLLSHTLFQDTTLLATTGYDTLFVTGLADFNATGLHIFPDPFTSGLNIQGIDEKTVLELYDMTGNLLYSAVCTGNCYIPRGNLPAGLYVVKITGSHNVQFRKVTVI